MTRPQNPGLMSAPLVSDWIVPRDEGFTVRTGRAELGQGAQTALLQMAAWELGMPAERLTLTGPDTGESPDEGFTAGSLSITQGGAALRAAASAVRVLALSEAARRLNADREALSVAEGAILDGGSDTGLTLPGLAAGIDLAVPVEDHAAPMAKGGPQVPRLDLRARMTGAPFVHDLAPEGLLHGRVFPAPTLTARLAPGFDTAPLAARPGVVAVVRDGSFLGLVAESEAEADAAAAWQEARLAWEDDADAETDIAAILEASPLPMEPVQEAPLPHTAPTAEITASRPFLSHGAMGPSAALAQWTGETLEVWCHSQGVYPLRKALATVLGLDPDAIRVRHVNGPGCYGHNGADDVALDAALLARAVPGRPVRLRWSRAAEFGVAPMGAAMSTRARVWLDEGRIAAMAVSVTSPPHATRPLTAGAPFLRSGALLEAPHPFPAAAPDLPMERGGGAARNAVPIYAAPALVERKLVTGLPWRTSSLRGLGAQVNVLAIETGVEAALMAGEIDPFEGRLASLDDPRARAVLERLRGMSGAIMADADGETRGWGIALARYKNTAAWAAVLTEVVLEDELRVPRVTVAVDMGEVVHPDGARNQIEGGIVQALSWTLKEGVTLDGARVATAGWEDYRVLRFSEVPGIETAFIDRPGDPPLGCAEAVAGPVSAAVANGVMRLVGVPVTRLPLTRDAIIAAISAA
ncbi:molybdopterin cofactor-binding domain-containing protein [Histidinibacterium lentulum]|uniref:Xanthine dehydrogenase family protein molybdopterin-binding subunit n=1 Tax=Histidinibacterium lentulum TaxID=2480588 RepID=A0A3N2QS32_9RHOB|nr:molybdopterin cofactor-binding domain-containing protein [Histidinibacterium lentulum]ROT97984.1 xanthine dehydrogenase family protein molybdopterin-binding subunit [Histidinibacterium lentulum]